LQTYKINKKCVPTLFFCTYSENLKPRATINMVEKILLVTDETENKKLCRKIIYNVSSLKN